MTVTLYCVVHGPIYQRYADAMWEGAREYFLPGEATLLQLPGHGGWPHGSASRYNVALEYWDWVDADWVFQIDADMLVCNSVGREILGDGLTVATHPGYPEGTDPDDCPYERRPESHACVPLGQGTRYHPGCFVGGTREAFRAMAEETMSWYEADLASRLDPPAIWYEESYLNRYLVNHPPAVVLDQRYVWWEHWGEDPRAIIVHRDKTAEEFANRG